MATVYLAQDLKHDRQVALKVLHPELAATLGPDRFQREVRTTARLQHPHILTVLDSGEASGQLWYTMPFVDGESLRDRLARERQLPLEDALQIIREVADALGYAHSQRVIHRDIKPENILLSRGHALVADFGVARAVEAAGVAQLTETGMAVGTPAYMSPEQSLADPNLDGRSDLYSLGCVLYEMLTGEAPYTGASAQAIIAKKLAAPLPSARQVRETVPAVLDGAIQRAMAKAPADRYATVEAFLHAVSHIGGEQTSSGNGVRSRQASVTPLTRVQWQPWLAVATLIGLGVLGILWLRMSSSTRVEPLGPKRLAVLPFTNVGDSVDAYFADGVTDAVRGKLAGLPGLQVIASSSSNEYTNTRKSPQQIGRELGVQYLLVGKVRWVKNRGVQSRVEVSPELVHTSTASTQWQSPFAGAVADVFEVQSRIASEVAQALGVVLGVAEREHLGAPPTHNLAAYDAFLQGQAASTRTSLYDVVALKQARDHYREAVRLDSSFAHAWAALSRTYANLYFYDLSSASPAVAVAARQAAERALTLMPSEPGGYLALGDVYQFIETNYERALDQYAQGQRFAPHDPRLLHAIGECELSLGRAEDALVHLRQAEALDPRSVYRAANVVNALLALRRYDEALAAVDRALALAPGNLFAIHGKMMVYLAQADLTGAQRVLEVDGQHVDPTTLVAYTASRGDLYWVLRDEHQQVLASLSPAAFGGSRADWAFALAELHALNGHATLARAYADSARIELEAQLRSAGNNGVAHAVLGVVLGYLGRREQAVREAERARGLMPLSSDLLVGGYVQLQAVRTYLLVGNVERALDRLEPLLERRYPFLSPGWLRVDPTFDPLRGNPRFERLMKPT